MQLNQLSPGTPFRVVGISPPLRATLKEVHGGGAAVIIGRPKEREFTTLDGRRVVFLDPNTRTETWSSMTPVVPE